MVSVEDVMPRLDSADFRAILPPEIMGFCIEYNPFFTQYIQTHWRDDYVNLWLDMRQLIATQGFTSTDRHHKLTREEKFLEDVRGEMKIINLPDGFTYWVKPVVTSDNWDKAFDFNPYRNNSLYRISSDVIF